MKKLLFVYNANSGYINLLIDGLHKMTKPGSYDCELCALTWTNVRMKKQWKEFITSLPVPVEVIYRDSLLQKYPSFKGDLPGLFVEEDNQLSELISKSEFQTFEDLEDLIAAVKNKTKNL